MKMAASLLINSILKDLPDFKNLEDLLKIYCILYITAFTFIPAPTDAKTKWSPD